LFFFFFLDRERVLNCSTQEMPPLQTAALETLYKAGLLHFAC